MNTLIRPITIMPPVTGIQYRRCFFENGAARSFCNPVCLALHGVTVKALRT